MYKNIGLAGIFCILFYLWISQILALFKVLYPNILITTSFITLLFFNLLYEKLVCKDRNCSKNMSNSYEEVNQLKRSERRVFYNISSLNLKSIQPLFDTN